MGEEVVRHAQEPRIPTAALSVFSPFPCPSPQLQCPFICLFIYQTSQVSCARCHGYTDEHSRGMSVRYQLAIWEWDGRWPEEAGNVKGVGFGDPSSRLCSLP